METKLDVCWSKGHDWKGLGTNTGVIRGAGSQGEKCFTPRPIWPTRGSLSLLPASKTLAHYSRLSTQRNLTLSSSIIAPLPASILNVMSYLALETALSFPLFDRFGRKHFST